MRGGYNMRILDKLMNKTAVKQETPDYDLRTKRERTIPPQIVACKVCGGKGIKEGTICPQCKGSGRVIVSCEVVTYVTAYQPEPRNDS